MGLQNGSGNNPQNDAQPNKHRQKWDRNENGAKMKAAINLEKKKKKYVNSVGPRAGQGLTWTKNLHRKRSSLTNCENNIVIIYHCIIWGKLLCHSKKSFNKKRNWQKIKMLRLATRLDMSWTTTENIIESSCFFQWALQAVFFQTGQIGGKIVNAILLLLREKGLSPFNSWKFGNETEKWNLARVD